MPILPADDGDLAAERGKIKEKIPYQAVTIKGQWVSSTHHKPIERLFLLS